MKPTDPQREAQENHAAASSLVTEGDEAGTTIVEIHARANSQRQPSGRSVRFSQDFASYATSLSYNLNLAVMFHDFT